MSKSNNGLDRLFYPKTVAMVGASPKSGKGWSSGNAYIRGSIKQNFQGKIYPVHPSGKTVLGFPSYRGIREIPDEIDLAVFTVSSSIALQVMEECVQKGVKFAHLLTAGFSETGRPEHAEMERKLVQTARDGGVRIVGPNCMGLYCPEGGVAWSDEFPNQGGPVGFFSQSGQLASHFIRTGAQQGLGFSKVVSFGNASDLQAHDFLNYLAEDDKTEVIGSYLEGLNDGRAFLQAAKDVTRRKPLVLWKGGQTEGGSRATQSHTAALAGSPSIWAALCRQTGIVSVRSLEEMVCTVSALQRLPRPAGTNVAILGGAGGGSVTMTDIAENEGLKVPHLTEGTIRQLEEFVPLQGNSARNPLDIGAALGTADHFMKLVDLLRDDPNIDALVFTLPLYWMSRDTGRAGVNRLLRGTIEARDRLQKPALFVLESDGDLRTDIMIRDARDWYCERKIPTFPSFQMAARVLSNLNGYREYLDHRV